MRRAVVGLPAKALASLLALVRDLARPSSASDDVPEDEELARWDDVLRR